jgi:hypothetical protein
VTGPDDALDELLGEGAMLLDLDAARAEAWASGLLADWSDHDALLAALEGPHREAARRAPASREAGPRAEVGALAIAVALVPMLPQARRVVDVLGGRGVEPPPFAPFVGTAQAVGAWNIDDRHGPGRSIVVEYEHGDGVRHDMLAELDGDVAVDLLVGPPGVVDAARDADDRRLAVEPTSPAYALDAIRRGMQRVLDGEVAFVTDAYLLNHALFASRVGLPIRMPDLVAIAGAEQEDAPSDDPEGDAAARAPLASALGGRRDAPAPDELVVAAAAAWRAAIDRDDADAVAVAFDARVDRDGARGLDDVEVLTRLAGAYVGRGPRTAMAPAAARAVDALEWADWLGAVLQLVRDGAGADASGEQLVRNINRCPEVTTSVPKRDAPAVASAFECASVAWRVAGAVDDDGRLTELGVWLLPRALAGAWGAPPGTV